MRRRHLLRILALCTAFASAVLAASGAAAALLTPGATAPPFTKNVLDASPWPTASQSQFLGKVVILHILGFDCQYCLSDGPSVETNLVQYYNSAVPGQVQVLGCDVTDGTVSQLRSFRTNTGVTYPLLLRCYETLASPQNLVQYYGERDHFAVVNKQGIVRYNSALAYAYGNGYHLNEIRACVDSLVTVGLGVPPPPPPTRLALTAGPSPVRGTLTVTLALPSEADARVAVHDVGGRRVAMLWDARTPAGEHALEWDGRDDRGLRVAPGVYLVVAETQGTRLSRRVVVVR